MHLLAARILVDHCQFVAALKVCWRNPYHFQLALRLLLGQGLEDKPLGHPKVQQLVAFAYQTKLLLTTLALQQVCYLQLGQPHLAWHCRQLSEQVSAALLLPDASFDCWRQSGEEAVFPRLQSLLEEEQQLLAVLAEFHGRLHSDQQFDSETPPADFDSYPECPLPLFAVGEQLAPELRAEAADQRAGLAALLEQSEAPAQAGRGQSKPGDSRADFGGPRPDFPEELLHSRLQGLSQKLSVGRRPSHRPGRLLLTPKERAVFCVQASAAASPRKPANSSAAFGSRAASQVRLDSSREGGLDRSFGCSASPRGSKRTGLASRTKANSSQLLDQSQAGRPCPAQDSPAGLPLAQPASQSRVDRYFSQALIYPSLARRSSRSPQHLPFEE